MSSSPGKRKVLLIGWDAADWEHINPLLEEGLLPTLDGLINRGVIGNLATLQPILSPMLWNSIATGKSADKHGIHGFIEPDPVNGGVRPYTSTSRKCKALWNILTQNGLRSQIVGWWASHPAEPINGIVVSNAFNSARFDPEKGWSVPPGTVHPKELGNYLARFKVFQNEISEAHVLPFIPDAAKIDQDKDSRLDTFARILSDNASIHAVATALLENEPWDFAAVYYDGVDHFSHAFMNYHPPKLPWIPQADFDMYKDVVRGTYRFHDMMLERLLQLAGPETTIILCSDHGFESGSQRPRGTPREPAGPAIWHRQYGILVMAGPGIKKDERIYGASLIDITPTVLTVMDLPIGEDMDGRPLLEAFETAPAVKTIPSWETVAGEAGQHRGNVEIDRNQSEELMQQFAALGYIEDPNADREKQVESAEIEAKYNVARTYLWKNQPDNALPLLAEITRRRPWEDRFILQLATAYFQGGYLAQAERLLGSAYDLEKPPSASLMLLWGRIKIAGGLYEEGLRSLYKAQEMNPRLPAIYNQIGDINARLLRWADAKSAYEKAIEIDEDNALAWQGLSSVYRRYGKHQETADTALRAVSLLHRLPVAHYNLGVAMARSGETARAQLAFETALQFQPQMLNAHRYLATIGAQGPNEEKTKFHRQEVMRISRKRGLRRRQPSERAQKLFDLPDFPSHPERQEILLRERPDPTPKAAKSGKTFILVSGLPRSGTSLMMQLLEAGGVSVLTDRERVADVDNPRGYYEWEPIKQIQKKPALLDDIATGTAIKSVSVLLQHLPQHHNYKVIFMMRPIDEVVTSQDRMVTRLQTTGADLEREQLKRGLQAHREEIRKWLKASPNMQALELDYPDLVKDPTAAIARLREFLGAELLPNLGAMGAVIDTSLYRSR